MKLSKHLPTLSRSHIAQEFCVMLRKGIQYLGFSRCCKEFIIVYITLSHTETKSFRSKHNQLLDTCVLEKRILA